MIEGRVSAIAESSKSYTKGRPARKAYSNNVRRFLEELIYELITTGESVKLPSSLGKLQVVRYKPKKKRVDFKSTKDVKDRGYDKTVFHTHKSTGGYWCRVHWTKYKYPMPNRTLWSFKLTRPNLRPNSYNKNNPKVSLFPYFKAGAWEKYREI